MRLIKLVLGFLALAFICLAAAHAAPGDFGTQDASDRRIVVFSPGTPVDARLNIAAAQGRVVRRLDLINAVVIEAPSFRLAAASAALKSHPSVVRVDDDPRINWLQSASTPSSFQELKLPRLDQFPRLERPKAQPGAPAAEPAPSSAQELPWGVARVDAPAAWKKTRGEGVKVCIIDTGIDVDHPDLKANIKGGWNAIAKSDDYKDDNGHGTHVAGTIAALDNGMGVVGVAPKADLYAVKVLDADGSGTYDDVIAGMLWAVDHHMQIASMSLGAAKGNDSLKAAVEAMVKGGVALIAAAGNSGPDPDTVGYPAAYPGAIAVAAMDSSNHVADFSSRGPAVALIAPGVDVRSTYMGGGYESMDGTSMATPHVSGLAALAVAAKGLSGYEAVRAALVGAATPLPDAAKTDQGAGVPDALKLVQ